MSGVVEAVADDAEEVLMFLGLAMLFLGAPLGAFEVSVFGLVVLVGAGLVGDTVGSVLRTWVDSDDEPEAVDPVEELQARYARGELSEAEFERKLERLLETEDVTAPGRDPDPDPGTDRARERDPERER